MLCCTCMASTNATSWSMKCLPATAGASRNNRVLKRCCICCTPVCRLVSPFFLQIQPARLMASQQAHRLVRFLGVTCAPAAAAIAAQRGRAVVVLLATPLCHGVTLVPSYPACSGSRIGGVAAAYTAEQACFVLVIICGPQGRAVMHSLFDLVCSPNVKRCKSVQASHIIAPITMLSACFAQTLLHSTG